MDSKVSKLVVFQYQTITFKALSVIFAFIGLKILHHVYSNTVLYNINKGYKKIS